MEGMIGEVILYYGTSAPQNWLLCDGSSYSTQSYTSLFSVVGSAYGGNGISTFNVPELSSPDSNIIYIICYQGTYPSYSS